MNYNIDGVLDLSQIKGYKIINNIDICKYIYTNDYINKNVNNITNNNIINNNTNSIWYESVNKNVINNNYKNENLSTNLTTSNDASQSIEILSVSIDLNEITKKKINTNNTNIYCINFIYSITLSVSINSKFEQININEIYSSSFTYKDIDTSYLEIYPINLEVKNLEDKIYFIINLITIDKTQELNLENSIEPNDQMIENINNKDYSYININQEFI